MIKQIQTFSFNPPKNLSEDSKWLMAVYSFQRKVSVLIITDENNSFPISTSSHWNSEDGEDLINRLNNF